MAEIYLSDGSIALVDDADYSLVCNFNWYRNGSTANRAIGPKGKRKSQGLADFIWAAMGNAPARYIRRSNGNNLDCRRQNLSSQKKKRKPRAKTPGKINIGACGFRGVNKPNRGGWMAQICIRRKRTYLGHFSAPEAAARAYDAAAYAAWGTDCYLNFPEEYGLPPRVAERSDAA